MTLTALQPALDRSSPPAVRPDVLRLQAARVLSTAHRQSRAADALAREATRLGAAWSGDAADAALRALVALWKAVLTSAEAHEQAADVLRACASRVEEAAALWQQAEALERQDAVARAVRAQAAARGAFVSPYEVDESPLRTQARRLAAEAHDVVDDAVRRAAAALDDLRPADRRPDLDALDQLRGVGTGAVDAVAGSLSTVADLSPRRLLTDRDGWLADVRALRDGAAYAADHPAEAGAAVLGLDLLQEGRYGEWAGAFVPDLLSGVLTGGAVPVARRSADVAGDLADLAEDVDDLQRVVRRVDTGGPVQPQPGAVMTPRYPTVIRDLEPARRVHILDGDERGGGHRAGAGKGKSEFPGSWTDDEIVRRVMQTARRPLRADDQPEKNDNLVAYGEHDGITIKVVVDPAGRVVTAHPIRRMPRTRNREEQEHQPA